MAVYFLIGVLFGMTLDYLFFKQTPDPFWRRIARRIKAHRDNK